ncbi:hypothetical protein K2173_007869 [Erythroxylum novogranatense]|uniref:Reverse transcriptase domain-containing protein n=1 Tax=Erythroxylum novogranatense TaxID=1862640 RepID=A0AAV8T6P2_9ROSI|nr:hypothetical protein K2173_007869 [Erythroxylum novogranatense]
MKRNSQVVAKQRLDRAVGNGRWFLRFPKCSVQSLVTPVSDHDPLLLDTSPDSQHTICRRFRFDNAWLLDANLEAVVVAGMFPPALSDTLVVLIPKIHHPEWVKDYRPIALCNVLYRIIAKVLANRLKKVLPNVISPSQSAFVPGRLITDNILVAFETIHSMKHFTWGSYSILVNGETVSPILPSRGLRQGDPLSPYLFIICAEGLSMLFNRAERQGLLHGHRVGFRCPRVSHFLFADDSIFFFKATEQETREVRSILEEYEGASGQMVNFQKSGIFYSPKVSQASRNTIGSILNVNLPLGGGKYLGLPSLIGRNKKQIFQLIKDRIWKKVNDWKNKMLSRAGKETLIKFVAQALPAYCMNVFQLPLSLCDELQKIMNSYWWGKSREGAKGIHWYAWDKMHG